MYSRKTAALLLWPSRPASPALPANDASVKPVAQELQRAAPAARPLNGLIRPAQKELAENAASVGLVAESYCTLLGMKLNEAVAKALIGGTEGPTWDRRRPVPAGKGKALGLLIRSEFTSGPNGNDTFTQRAILRSMQRPLSVLLTNIQRLMTPLLASTQFLPAHPVLTTPPAAQVHALALAVFAGELNDALLIPDAPRFVNDGLAPYRAQLSALETRACLPIVTALKTIVTGFAADLIGASSAPKEHPGLAAFNQSLAGTSKLLNKLLGPEPTHKRQIWVAELLTHVIWEGMVALVCRPRNTYRPASPERRASPPPGPILAVDKGDVSSRFGIKQLVSRPVTPAAPLRPSTPSALSRDAHAFHSIIAALVSACPPFSDPLASDLVTEALLSLSQLQTLFSFASPPSTEAVVPELDLLPSALVLAYLLPEGKLASLLAMDAMTFKNHCLADENSAEQCEGVVEQVARDWVSSRVEWMAVNRWLIGGTSS